eukprot:TRINITY_DN9262_c0_g1_i1.p1 TRINITY_DN9262_c0_g1~~TRINITY_DN9262_c0_g1_i1.p1  ORF type:complete len:107 (-),score=17.45 TRINITY_DN9262_c0_g1_i1:121-441(-)
MKMGGAVYKVSLKADNSNFGLTVTLSHQTEVPPHLGPKLKQLIGDINKEVTLGQFCIVNQQFVYSQTMVVVKDLAVYQWVTEALLAALTLTHHYAVRYEALMKEKK